MEYLLLMAELPDAPPADPSESGAPTAWLDEMLPRDVLRYGDRLRPKAEARTVGIRDGKALWTHGPYAEVQEQVAGFDVIEAADLDEAIEIAAKHPCARSSAVEIRPLWNQT